MELVKQQMHQNEQPAHKAGAQAPSETGMESESPVSLQRQIGNGAMLGLAGRSMADARTLSYIPPASTIRRLPSPVIQRFITTEPAGGCGVCFGMANLAGIEAHRVVQLEFEILHPFGLVEFPISSPTDDNGRLDLAIATPTGFRIGEIKPANEQGYENGILDIAFYIEALEALYPNATIEPLTDPIPPSIFPDPLVAPTCPVQEIFVNPPVGGVYGYYCDPPFSRLIRNPNCRCGTPPPVPVPQEQEQEQEERRRVREREPRMGEYEPEPIRVPRPVFEQIREFIRRVVEGGEDAYQAARRFLEEHPEVLDYLAGVLIGVAVVIVVATIIEDIGTLGGGIADDPACFAAAYALVQTAQAMGR